jgi:Outer membrane lipoprotein-sorting protein
MPKREEMGMRVSFIKQIFLILLLVTATAILPAMALTGLEIVKKVVDRESPKTSKVTSVMRLINKRGEERVRKLEFWSKDTAKGKRRLIRFLEPADVRGTGFLVWEHDNADNEQYLWLPALKKPPRKIASSDKSSSFMGSEMTYGDMEARDVEQDNHELQGEETCPGHASFKCWKIKSTPRQDSDDYQYSYVIQWVRQDNYVPIRIDFYDLDGEFLKRMKIRKLEKINGFWTPKDSIMENEQNGRSTVLIVEKVENDIKIDDKYFKLRFLSKF